MLFFSYSIICPSRPDSVHQENHPLHTMPKHRQNILDLSFAELRDTMQSLNEPPFRAAQLHRSLYGGSLNSFSEMTTLSLKLRSQLTERFSIIPPETIRHTATDDEHCSPAEKLLLRLADGKLIEAVLIPSNGRMTACISSQAGCKLQCSFCATGSMGFERNLTPGEMILQVHELQRLAKHRDATGRITNVVFMGMGEPLLNMENVYEAISTLCHYNYETSLSEKKVTISTAGIVPGIVKLAESSSPLKLAVSLHAAEQEKRKTLMPVTATMYPLDQLEDALSRYTTLTGRPVTLVYMLLAGINDSMEDAKKLVHFSRRFLCKINLIDYNSIINMEYKPVCSSTSGIFQKYLINAGLHVTVRKSCGSSIDAACGQLATNSKQCST